ncbi:MAG: flotillin family protein [Gemmatimonadetes bacterium]|nr:flotillin family protein [Gemmatimonadota bacterium]
MFGGLENVGITAGIVVLAAILVAIWTVKTLIIIVPPNEAAVITGRKRTMGDRTIGYRTVIGGRTIRIPIIERVHYLSLETIPLEVQVTNAFSKGNIPLSVQAVANVKIASEPETDFNNAVERVLGKTSAEIEALAKETLMGNLRGVLATLTPEEVNEDRLAFAQNLVAEAEEDLKKLGFQLDVLKIQNVSDDVGYLDSIGRKKTAVVKKEAEVAEAENEAETRRRQAEYRQEAETAEAKANITIAEAQNRLRVRQAELDREAETAEKVARVSAEQAEVQAQRELERERVATERERLAADVVAPAEADRLAAEQRARAEAAPIIERGRAQALALEALRLEIGKSEDGFAIFMAEKLPALLDTVAKRIEGIDIDRMVVFDNGDGGGVANAASQRVNGTIRTLEQIAGAFDIDLSDVMRGMAARAPRARATDDGNVLVAVPTRPEQPPTK